MRHLRQKYASLIDPTNRFGKDEPVFVLRAKDVLAPQVLRHWAYSLIAAGGDARMAKGVLWWADQFEAWAAQNGHKLPDLDEGEKMLNEMPIAGMSIKDGEPVFFGNDGKLYAIRQQFSMDFNQECGDPVVMAGNFACNASGSSKLYEAAEPATGTKNQRGQPYDKEHAMSAFDTANPEVFAEANALEESYDKLLEIVSEYNDTMNEWFNILGIKRPDEIVVSVKRKKKGKKKSK